MPTDAEDRIGKEMQDSLDYDFNNGLSGPSATARAIKAGLIQLHREQLAAVVADAEASALERAAKVVDTEAAAFEDIAKQLDVEGKDDAAGVADGIMAELRTASAAIRALKGEQT